MRAIQLTKRCCSHNWNQLAFENTRSHGNLMVRSYHQLLFRVLHGMPVAPVGIEHTQIKLALDEKLLEQDQERLGIEVAAR